MNASGFVLSTFDLKYVLSKSHNTGAMNFKSPSIPEGKCTVAEEDLALSMQDLASRKQDLASTKERHVIDWSVWHTLLAFQSIPSSILEIVKPERSFWESFEKERRHRNTWMTVIDTSRAVLRVWEGIATREWPGHRHFLLAFQSILSILKIFSESFGKKNALQHVIDRSLHFFFWISLVWHFFPSKIRTAPGRGPSFITYYSLPPTLDD